jgi:hypothetical protein
MRNLMIYRHENSVPRFFLRSHHLFIFLPIDQFERLKYAFDDILYDERLPLIGKHHNCPYNRALVTLACFLFFEFGESDKSDEIRFAEDSGS